jgi:hypothetical protein
MIPILVWAFLMIAFMVKDPSGSQRLDLTIQDGVLVPDIADIARHFLAGGKLRIYCDHLNKYLRRTADGVSFIAPNMSNMEDCFPPGREITLSCTAEWDDSVEYTHVPAMDTAKDMEVVKIPTYDNTTMESYSLLLRRGIYPVDCNNKKDFRKRVNKHYYINANGDMIQKRQTHRPYKESTSRVYSYERVVVPTAMEMKALALPMHAKQHPGVNKLEGLITQKYKYDGLRQVLQKLVTECDGCGDFVTKKEPTNNAIISSRVLQRVLFDYFEMPFKTPEGYKFVLLMKCHFTKYMWGQAYKVQCAADVVNFMMAIFQHLPLAEIFHSDNGSPFIAEIVHLLFQALGNPEFVHGAPYHPQSQGLIENGVKDIKQKLKKQARDEGITVPGTVYDWVPALKDTLNMVNDLPIKMYNNKVTPFMALNGGAPRNMPQARKPSGMELAEVHADMFRKQVQNARKRGLGVPEQELDVGTVVRVRATETEMAKKFQLGQWTARGIVHGKSSQNDQYYVVRWITPGVGTKLKSNTNDLSQPLYRGSIRPITVGKEILIATVYHDEQTGDLVEVHHLTGDNCTYMFLNGVEAGNVFSSSREGLRALPNCPYPMWVTKKEEERKSMEAAMKPEDLETPGRKRGKQTDNNENSKKKKPKYVGPSPTTTHKEYVILPPPVFEGSDDPKDGMWIDGETLKSNRTAGIKGVVCRAGKNSVVTLFIENLQDSCFSMCLCDVCST